VKKVGRRAQQLKVIFKWHVELEKQREEKRAVYERDGQRQTNLLKD
jgi:hypothetical protein